MDTLADKLSKINLAEISDVNLTKLIRDYMKTRSLTDAYQFMLAIRAVTRK